MGVNGRFYPRGKRPEYSVKRRVGWAPTQAECFGKEKSLFPARNRTTVPRKSSLYPTHYTNYDIHAFFLSESKEENPQKRQSPSRDLNTQDPEYEAKFIKIKTRCLFSIT